MYPASHVMFNGAKAYPDPAQDRIKADKHNKRIGILVVAYNAVSTIGHVLQRIPDSVWIDVEEVVIFDDASHDHTYEVAVGMKTVARFEKLTILKNEKNQGYGGNQKLGYRYFMQKGMDIVVLLHGDGQYAPEMLAQMYAPLVRGEADAVFGSRMMKDFGGPVKGGMPIYKYTGNKILTWFENRALGLSLTEFHSGYRAYNLHALGNICLDTMTNDFHFDTQIIIKLHHQHFRIMEIPIPTYYGNEICYVNGMKYARDVFKSVRRYKQTAIGARSFPEYKEFFPFYPLKSSPGSSHALATKWLGSGHRILDIGCADGYFAEVLMQNGNTVFGIDQLKQPAKRSAMAGYVQADLSSASLKDAIAKLAHQRFEVITLLDVLEHLPSPEVLLRECKQFLTENGIVIVSVPNVANLSVRIALLFGRFNYADRGILDRTHLRFFTRKTLQELITSEGYEVRRLESSVIPIDLALGLQRDSWLVKLSNSLLRFLTKLFPGLLAYQVLLLASPKE